MGHWLNKLQYIHTMQYYAAMKKEQDQLPELMQSFADALLSEKDKV